MQIFSTSKTGSQVAYVYANLVIIPGGMTDDRQPYDLWPLKQELYVPLYLSGKIRTASEWKLAEWISEACKKNLRDNGLCNKELT